MKLARTAIFLSGFLLLMTGCTNESRPEVYVPVKVSPVATAGAWFRAINEKNRKSALAYVEPNKKGIMDWGPGGASQWPTFSDVQCRMDDLKLNFSEVYCSFTESPVPTAGNPITFWTVAMRRHPSGPWLITNYGQG